MQNEHNWLDRNEYPFQSNFFHIGRTAMHYIDEGEGDVILFVHGTPSWSFEYRNIIRGLSQRYRCIAIDHIGFGLSAKPADYNYNMAQHADNLERFIEHLQLRDFTMVLHDFGGPIGLQYAVNHPGNIR